MDIRILQTLLLATVLLNVFRLVVGRGRFCNNPSPPVCADDCNGNGYYLNEDETACIQCPTCTPGQELNKVCGNGLNGDAACIPCQEGYYSSSTSKHCTPCTICINTLEDEPCQRTQDRVCGNCLSGFARSSERFSTNHNECPDRCSDLPRETPECSDWWSNQDGDLIEPEQPNVPPPIENPVEVVPLDGPDPCEPVPPRCIDPCDDGNYFLDKDGLCKACLQCQPGEELNKVCGRGRNGDAFCQRCPGGTFSEDGLERCTPCRICVNTVATECTSTRDSECGECLPGYYQDADGFFPDRGACPNRCMECPSTIPQCQEWCESSTHPDTVIIDAADHDQVAVSPSIVEFGVFQSDADEKEDNVEVAPAAANHASYTMIFTVLTCLLAVVIIILVVILFVFRNSWKRSRRSNASITAETTLLPSATSSPRSSPESTPSTVYRPTTYPIPSDGEAWEFTKYLRENLNGSRPVSGSSADGENRSSAASTPTMNLHRRLENMEPMRHTLERQVGVYHDGPSTSAPQHPLPHPGSVTGEHTARNSGCSPNRAGPFHVNEKHPSHSDRDKVPNEMLGYLEDMPSPRRPSSSKVVMEEKESGTVHPHLQDEDEAPGRLVRRRQSVISNSGNDEQLQALLGGSRLTDRRYSLPGLKVGSGNTHIKKSFNGSNGNTAHVPEPEAALFPPGDSARDEASITNVLTETKIKSADPNHRGQSLELTTSPSKPQPDANDTEPGDAKAPLATLPETPPTTQTYPERNPTPDDVRSRSPGNQSYAVERNVTININMATQAIETVHVGNVHNKHNCDHQNTTASGVHDDDGDDEDETIKLLNVNTATGLHGGN